ncbi:MAG: hypothetical protein A2W19_02090 [Spirochaetes bacterium RBG_16_49_21]|nr:MAG: hypothetical protein A2W19_02090 [Spirochaetes bacterium RBG_16_49_21]
MSKLHKKLPRLNFKHVIFKFPDELENNYYEDFFRISLPIVRIALILAIVLYALFGILDIWIVPLSKKAVWLIRYAFVSPILIITLIFTFSDLFKRYMQMILAVIGFILGFGIVMMIGFIVESELGFKFYYAGLMLVLMWVYALARIRFVYATAVSWLITFSYEIVAIAVNKMLGSLDNIMVFINNNFFFISANVIGMFASFTIEWYMRKNFLLRMEIEKSNVLNQKYMDNIKEGLLLIDENYNILNQYSEYLTGMFENRMIADKNFIDLIYPEEDEHRGDRRELEKFLDFLFHNKSADIDMIMDVNPFKNKKILIKTNEFLTKEIIVNADFIRIYDKDTVEYLMVIFEDITDIIKYERRLEEQKTKYHQEVESISAILKSGPEIFSNFLEESSFILNDIQSKINNLADPKILNHVFRQAHSLKGSAKHLGLNFMSTISHKIEDVLITARDNPGNIAKKSTGDIKDLIAELFQEFQNLAQMIERFKIFSTLRNVRLRGNEWKGPLGDFLNSLPQMVNSLAQDLKKHVKLEIENSLVDIPFLAKIKSPIIHLIRNSMDHGIEDQFERLTKNKNATGKIVLRLFNSDSSYSIEVEDDGSGIDFEKIKDKAIEKKLIVEGNAVPTKAKLIRLIFTPSFSSASAVTEISGRGYGLDIVKDAAEKLHGKIQVQTKKGEGTKIAITIPR